MQRVSLVILLLALIAADAWADGKMVGPAMYKKVPYKGSVEERSQEAIIIFHSGRKAGEATEDMILKVSVQGEVDNFAWVIPFPNEPESFKEDAKLFTEIYSYVESRMVRRPSKKSPQAGADREAYKDKAKPVDVISRKIVGSYDVAVVRENEKGALNKWLVDEGYQSLGDDAADVLDFYREKKYVYACAKVSVAKLQSGTAVDLHPLRFSFKTGGRDGLFFPMKMTGLQQQRFDVNLYVFYHAWLNDHLNKFGYEHRGFTRKYRDWDSSQCEPNAGKTYSMPERDPFLKDSAHLFPTVTKLFRKLHPGERYYLTNIRARGLNPEEVRDWSDDLWLFPYYVDKSFVPYDVQNDGPASAAWPNEQAAVSEEEESYANSGASLGMPGVGLFELIVIGGIVALCVLPLAVAAFIVTLIIRRRRSRSPSMT